MGQEGKILRKKEDKRVEPSSHTAASLFGPTNHDGETLITTGDKTTDQLPHCAELAMTDSYLVSVDEYIESILDGLRDDGIYVIGLIGMDGAGKTTIAKEVAKKAKELNVINLVVYITMPERAHVKEIQGKIAKALDLRWVTKDLSARARQIFQRLQSEKRILIILDDVWVTPDLKKIGIPSSEEHKGCKLLLTSSSEYVAIKMRCQKIYHKFLLTEDASWSLFCKWARIQDVSGDKSIVAASLNIVKECRGVPLAIVVAGGFLRGKNIEEWKVAKDRYMITLQDASQGDWEYNSLPKFVKLSYEVGLSSQAAKSLIIISALYPENEIRIDDLYHYAITLGLCPKNKVNAAINTLIYSGLLLHYDESRDHVIMHSLVRKAVLRIAEREKPVHRDSIRRYLMALQEAGSSSNSDDFDDEIEDFRWEEKLEGLVRQMFHVTESMTSSSIVPFSPHVVYTNLEPSGKLVDFKGVCQVDESYLPLLKEACKRYPHLISCQAKHSKKLKQTAFDILGHLLFVLNNASVRGWVYLNKDELQLYWNQALILQFDLGWLKPTVDRVLLSSTEIDRIEALRKEEEKRNAKVAMLRLELKQEEQEAAHYRKEIAMLESNLKMDGLAIAHVSNAAVVSIATPVILLVLFVSIMAVLLALCCARC